MKISKTHKTTPDRPTPSAATEEYVWKQLAPRLLSPGALAIIRTLLREGRPLSPTELTELVELSTDHARYHCKAMATRGVLEVTHLTPRPEGGDDEPSYYFPKPRQAAPSPPATKS
jgi:predicted transcriptional regulator